MIRRPRAHELIIGMSVDMTFGPLLTFGAGGNVTSFTDNTGLSFAVSYAGNGSTCVTVAWGLGGAVAGSIAALTGAIAAIFGGAIGNMLGNEMSNACNGGSSGGSGQLLTLTPFII